MATERRVIKIRNRMQKIISLRNDQVSGSYRSKRPVVLFSLLLLVAACDQVGPMEVDTGMLPAFDVVEITEEEEAQLQSILKIIGQDAEVIDWRTIYYWAEATVHWISPTGPLVPAIRSDAIVVRTVEGVTASPISIPGHYQIEGTGVRGDWKPNLPGDVPDCVSTFGRMDVTSTHWAKWSYMVVASSIRTISKGPTHGTDFDECKRRRGQQSSGGIDPSEGDCELCQQWFWYEDGVIIDDWWECEPIDSGYCDGMLLG